MRTRPRLNAAALTKRTNIMDLNQIFWMFFMLSALQPVIRQRWLEAARRRLLDRIERERRSRVVLWCIGRRR